MITVPEDFAIATVTREGDAGRRWVDALPDLVKTLCDQWDLMVDGAPMHGYLGLVVPVRRGDEYAILKVSWVDESSTDEAAELDPALARSWTLVRCVDYWLWGLSVGLTNDPACCDTIINWLL